MKFFKSKGQLIFFISVALLAVLYFQPLWVIALEAPQYPGGIKMYIWINQITGEDEHTLANINILNHYIGMKYIVPESIPELKYFPKVIAGLLLIGTGVTLSNRWKLMASFAGLLLILSALGIYDFYLWEYDYGHNLDPSAPIKVEGMAYQPPLIGVKWLLNFKAISFPHVGGMALTLANILAVIGTWFAYKKAKA